MNPAVVQMGDNRRRQRDDADDYHDSVRVMIH